MAKLVVMIRLKDSLTFIHEWLACYEKLADEIVALDNGSTDGCLEILQCIVQVLGGFSQLVDLPGLAR